MEDAQNKALPDIGIPGPKSIELGKLVRETWVNWAKEQNDPKPSWLVDWDELDDGQKTVDILIGQTVAEYCDRIAYNDPNSYSVKAKEKIKQLETLVDNQTTVINALNRSVGQLLHLIRQYFDASKKVLDTQLAIKRTDDEQTRATAVTKHIDALCDLKQIASTKQAVDMGPYEAVDFVRLASSYIELREAAREVLSTKRRVDQATPDSPWAQFKSTYDDEAHQAMVDMETCLKNYPVPDTMPLKDISVPVQVTSITITAHVRELIAMLEPDTKVEAVVYENGKAVIMGLSTKLAVLTEAVGEFLYNWPYQNVPHANPMHWYNKLRRTYETITRHMAPTSTASDPIGYTTLKLKVLQVAAKALLDAWNTTPQTAIGALDRLNALDCALKSLEMALKQTDGERGTQEGKGLQV